MQWKLSSCFYRQGDVMVFDARDYLDQVRRDIAYEFDRLGNSSRKYENTWQEIFEDVRSNSGYSIETARDILWNSAHKSCLDAWYVNDQSEAKVREQALSEGFGLVIPVSPLLWDYDMFIAELDTDDHGDIQGIYEIWLWEWDKKWFKHPILELYAKGIITFTNAMHLVPEEWHTKGVTE